jgi:signal transduction histidine kinase
LRLRRANGGAARDGAAGARDALVYSRPMSAAAVTAGPRGFSRVLGWRRVRVVLIASLVLSVLLQPAWQASWAVLFLRMVLVGLVQLLVFGLFERRPKRLPRWLARWALQVAGVAAAVPPAVAIAYSLTTFGDAVHWTQAGDRMSGFAMITAVGLLVTPWIAMSALYRQIGQEAQRQALAFELERSEHRRSAAETRLRLLQAQVEPHFLFNTLANVRELVDSGSPQASAVLGSLIAYLRAAVPRLHEPAATLAQEIELARAYLEVMHMRMPDRLQYTLHADDATLALPCPPMTLLTLVENAVRHGIDPGEEGGRIDVRVRLRDGRCRIEVADTGVCLPAAGEGPGTGLANLRERLQLAFGNDAQLRLVPLEPHGVCAEAEFPAMQGPA